MKRCKRDGGNTNSLGVVNEDRISELPEALILQILSLLPTKEAIATSVLSKQWHSHWKMLPKLKFDCCRGLELGNFFRTLLSHNAPVLQSFHLNVRLGTCNSVLDTGIITGLALSRNVRELVLEVESDTFFTFPRCLYNCETLETLKLKTRAAITDVPSTVCMKSLRTLHLDGVDFNDDDSVLNLLFGCPNLENLEVHRDLGTSVKTYIIAVPSLQRLSIYNNYRGNQHYVISAPSLKYLKILGFNAPESCLIQNVPELVEASLTNLDNIIDENLLGSLTSVKRLSLALSPVKVKFPTGSIIFNHLLYLELFTTKVTWWNLLTLMLDSSPKLQVLKLNNRGWIDDFVARGEWNPPKNVPECLLLHLETFMWESYKWDRQDEIEVAKYILSNTKYLKRATFTLKHINLEDRRVVVKDLKSVVKDTNSCQIQFN